jgi:hypothetical protein
MNIAPRRYSDDLGVEIVDFAFFTQFSNFHKTHDVVLCVSSFDGLIQQQYNSGNVYKIYEKFPKLADLKTIKSISKNNRILNNKDCFMLNLEASIYKLV